MDEEFLLKCDALLNALPSERIMNPSEAAGYLGVSEDYAITVIDRLRKDGLASGVGTGPVSKNNRTSTFPNFYKIEIRKIKEERKTRLYAWWGFWIAVISISWQILAWITGLIMQK